MSQIIRSRRCSAFTLVELLTVIAIIGVLAGILMIVLSRMRVSANTAACISNWRQTDAAVKLFVADNKGRLPLSAYSTLASQQVWYQIAPYMVPNARSMTNSAQLDNLRNFMFRKMGCQGSDWDFGFNTFVSGKSPNSVSQPARTIYGIDLHGAGSATAQWFDGNVLNGTSATKRAELTQGTPKPHSGRVNVLYVDGHVETRLVSSLMKADATRDSPNYLSSHETTPIGDPAYDQ